MERGKLCIVVPCHNEEQSLPALFERMDLVEPTLSGWVEGDVEFVLVDDGSTDGTLAALRELHVERPSVHYVSFSRNFGKEAGLAAGLRKAMELDPGFVAVMDADLQDPPELLAQMFSKLEEGFDVAAAYRTTRAGEPPVRSWFAERFYDVINRISDVEMKSGARDFRLMTARTVRAILSLPETSRFSKGIFSWVGYRTHWLEVENAQRAAGQTKWSFFKLCLYAMDGIIAFSTAPLAIASVLGLAFCVIAFIAIIFVIVRQLIWGGSAFGWPSMVCILLFVTGIQLFCIGILGQYLSKTYLEVKRRPIYILRESGGGEGHAPQD